MSVSIPVMHTSAVIRMKFNVGRAGAIVAPFCIAGITMAMVNCRIAGSALARASLMGMHRFFSVTAASVYLIPGMYMINRSAVAAATFCFISFMGMIYRV